MSDPFDLAEAPPPEPTRAVSAPPSDAYLQGLNETQRQAVEQVEGPLLVLAGALRAIGLRVAILDAGRNEWTILVTSNSPLPSNNIRHIHHDVVNRRTFISTEGGLAVLAQTGSSVEGRGGKWELRLW